MAPLCPSLKCSVCGGRSWLSAGLAGAEEKQSTNAVLDTCPGPGIADFSRTAETPCPLSNEMRTANGFGADGCHEETTLFKQGAVSSRVKEPMLEDSNNHVNVLGREALPASGVISGLVVMRVLVGLHTQGESAGYPQWSEHLLP